MPHIHHAGADLYWEEHGSGEPLLLIMGLSYPASMWYRLLPTLKCRFRTILLDNRGVGSSSVPKGPYPISLMARDAAAVLDAAGVGSAHVLGASMGGMIAQELALLHPERVRSLVLGCTMAAGLKFRWSGLPQMVAQLRLWQRSPEECARRLVSLLYHPSTPVERIDEDMAVRLRELPTVRGYLCQVGGLLSWNAAARVSRLRVPTLVLHGDSDRIIAPEQGQWLARQIPGARFSLIPDAGHMLMTDQPEMVERHVQEFLERQVPLAYQPA
jgi:3-oxoadipate enol-lactonase